MSQTTRTPLSVWSPERAERMVQRGFLETAADPSFLQKAVQKITAGMMNITTDAVLQRHLSWRTQHVDAYGPKYKNEVGLRLPEEGNVEQKYVFHYTRDMPGQETFPQLEPFFGALERLEKWARAITFPILCSFDAWNQGRPENEKYLGLVKDRVGGHTVIRVLRYRRTREAPGAPDALPHIDRSLLTVHVYASHPGLRIFGPDGEPSCVGETCFDQVAIFPGEKLTAATRGNIQGTLHGVRDERIPGREDQDRIAIVVFTHPVCIESDARWLLENRHTIEAFEQRLIM